MLLPTLHRSAIVCLRLTLSIVTPLITLLGCVIAAYLALPIDEVGSDLPLSLSELIILNLIGFCLISAVSILLGLDTHGHVSTEVALIMGIEILVITPLVGSAAFATAITLILVAFGLLLSFIMTFTPLIRTTQFIPAYAIFSIKLVFGFWIVMTGLSMLADVPRVDPIDGMILMLERQDFFQALSSISFQPLERSEAVAVITLNADTVMQTLSLDRFIQIMSFGMPPLLELFSQRPATGMSLMSTIIATTVFVTIAPLSRIRKTNGMLVDPQKTMPTVGLFSALLPLLPCVPAFIYNNAYSSSLVDRLRFATLFAVGTLLCLGWVIWFDGSRVLIVERNMLTWLTVAWGAVMMLFNMILLFRNFDGIRYVSVLFAILFGVLFGIVVGYVTTLAIVGLLISARFFDANVIGSIFTGNQMRSDANRSFEQTVAIQRKSNQIAIVTFNAYVIAETMIERIRYAVYSLRRFTTRLEYLILDLSGVHELVGNISSISVFLQQLQQQTNCEIYIVLPMSTKQTDANINALRDQLHATGTLVRFSLDHALTDCETALLDKGKVASRFSNWEGWAKRFDQIMGSPGTASQFMQMLSMETFSSGQAVIEQNAESDKVYFAEHGGAFVAVKSEEGVYVAIAQINPGDVFGEIGFFVGEQRIASVIATEELRCYTLDRSNLNEMLKDRAEALKQLIIYVNWRCGMNLLRVQALISTNMRMS